MVTGAIHSIQTRRQAQVSPENTQRIVRGDETVTINIGTFLPALIQCDYPQIMMESHQGVLGGKITISINITVGIPLVARFETPMR